MTPQGLRLPVKPAFPAAELEVLEEPCQSLRRSCPAQFQGDLEARTLKDRDLGHGLGGGGD